MSKRQGVAGLACIAAAMIAVGCGSDSNSGTSSASTPLKDQNAVIVHFGGSVGNAVEQAFGNPVAKATGMKITYDAPTDYAKLQTQVETGNVSWTVLEADPWWALQQCGKLLSPIPASVRTAEKIDPKYAAGACSVPGGTWSFNVAYDPKFAADPPTGWADFFNTKKYPGKRALWGSYAVNGALEGALLADGVAPDKLYPLDLDRAIKKLDTIKSDTTFFDTTAQVEQLMQNRQITMAITAGNQAGFSGGFNPVWNQSLESWDAYIVPKGANLTAATPILKNILTASAQTKFTSLIPFGGTLKTPLPPPTGVSKQFASWSSVLPAHREGAIPLDQEYYAKNYDTVNSRWTSFVQG